MKNLTEEFYRGVIFYFICIIVYSIISDLLIYIVLKFQISIYFITISLFLLVFLISFVFYNINKIPRINIWYVFLIITASFIIDLLPNKYFSLVYSADRNEKIAFIMNNIFLFQKLNTFILIFISFKKIHIIKTIDK